MVEEAGDGEGADTAGNRGDGGEVGALSDLWGDVALKDAFFGGGASVDQDGARFNEITSD